MTFSTIVSPDELSGLLGKQNLVIADCRFSLNDPERGRRAWMDEHLPGAIYVHLDEDLSGEIIPGKTGRHPLPTVEDFSRTASRLGIGSDVQVIAYDDENGAFAARLWWLLRWTGHDRVAVLEGGFARWKREGRPTESGIVTPRARTFTPDLHPEMMASADLVEKTRTDPTWRILDAREPERFRGEVEPIDPVAGHIPGAISAPYRNNLDDQGNFLPANALRELYEKRLENTPPDRTIYYCGSGVTAAHNVLAQAHAGRGLPRLYAGSWSEWITDPTRPVAKGPENPS